MTKAIFKNGLIQPIEPIPRNWQDGQELRVEEAAPSPPFDVDKWKKEMDALCADFDDEDYARMQAAIDEHRGKQNALTAREIAPYETGDEFEKEWRQFDADCAAGDPEDFARMQIAIDEHRREQKELMRKEMAKYASMFPD